jgi:hypothetical protein
LRREVDRQFVKKWSNPIGSAIVNFVITKKPF